MPPSLQRYGVLDDHLIPSKPITKVKNKVYELPNQQLTSNPPMPRHLIPRTPLLTCNREPERTHDVSGRCPLSSRDHGGISLKQWRRRSRYWCGPGSFRETKKAPARGFIGHWSAPAFCSAGGRSAAGIHQESKKGSREQTIFNRNAGPLTNTRQSSRPKCRAAFGLEDFHRTRPCQCRPAACISAPFGLIRFFPLLSVAELPFSVSSQRRIGEEILFISHDLAIRLPADLYPRLKFGSFSAASAVSATPITPPRSNSGFLPSCDVIQGQ